MIIKIMQRCLKTIFLLSFLLLGTGLNAAPAPVATNGSQPEESALSSSLNNNAPRASSKYMKPDVIQQQRAEQEEANVARREENQIGVLFSDQFRKQNNTDANFFEEEVLRSQMNDTGVFLEGGKLESSRSGDRSRIRAIQEGVLADYRKNTEDNDGKILNFKNPIFFVSEGVDTFSYTNTMNLCTVVNLGSRNVDCLVYPEIDINNIASVLRRGQKSDFFDKTGMNADFIIVRDDVYSQYKTGRGPLALAPDLDLMMYLNGDYLFMFANSMSNTFSFEHLSAQKRGKQIRVGYVNQQSRVIFERTLARIYPNHAYRYVSVDVSSREIAGNNICNPTDIDIFIFFGGKLPDNLSAAMEDCASMVNPLTLSDVTLAEVVKLTDFFSVANVVGYFPTTSVINYLEIYMALERSYKAANQNSDASEKLNLADYADSSVSAGIQSAAAVRQQNQAGTSAADARTRELDARRQRAEQLRKQRDEERVRRVNELKAKREEEQRKRDELLAKKNQPNQPSRFASFFSFLNFSSKKDVVQEKKEGPVFLNQELIIKEDSLNNIKGRANNTRLLGGGVFATDSERLDNNVDNVGRIYVTANTAIKTFGIRYVLLASRYAKRENVMSVFDAVIKDYFLLRDNILTPDMAKFNISDIILGTQGFSVPNYYHPALAKYPSVMLEQRTRKTPEQTIAIRLLSNTASNNNISFPSSFGPATLTTAQMDDLYTKARELNRRKEELAAIRIFQRDTVNINNALEDIRNNRTSSDSLLRATGLDYVNAIVDEQSVMTQGMLSEERLSPDAMRELERLVAPPKLPVPTATADDVKNAVDGAGQGSNNNAESAPVNTAAPATEGAAPAETPHATTATPTAEHATTETTPPPANTAAVPAPAAE
ncbi:MAG: hypothetical protein LBQ34_04255 [Alphaproteobacteria bacterium]|jgi:hypothetical protein|nr:hypothetical protein [Alphaproteobacteria bacterium]